MLGKLVVSYVGKMTYGTCVVSKIQQGNSVSAVHILNNQNTYCEAEDVMTELNYV